jgi:hypothetical protein
MPPTESAWPFIPKRRQYPISVWFATRINKSQLQSLNMVGLYLPKQVSCMDRKTICSILKSDKKGWAAPNGQWRR